MKNKAIVMLSGGLDSMLTAKILLNEGFEVRGLNFVTEFASGNLDRYKERIRESADAIKLKYRTIDISKSFMSIMKNPEYGFGSNINPCIDCKIFMLKKAREIMKDTGASFIATGEVLGERPMSQRLDALNSIERKSGLKGYLLRPLSAKLLKPTIAEEKGIIKREHLYGIRGRSRKPQIALAKKLKITKHFAPAGGCLLTDPGFSRRLKDLREHDTDNMKEIRLLKFGRHFRLTKDAKLIVGRDEKENGHIEKFITADDIVLEPNGYTGPLGVIKGKAPIETIKEACCFFAGHTKKKADRRVSVSYKRGKSAAQILQVRPLSKEKIDKKRI